MQWLIYSYLLFTSKIYLLTALEHIFILTAFPKLTNARAVTCKDNNFTRKRNAYFCDEALYVLTSRYGLETSSTAAG